MDLMEIVCEDGRRMELAQVCVQLQAVVLAVFRVCDLISNRYLRKI
jgi:hypothetical protein